MEQLRQVDLRALLGFIRDCYAIPEYEYFEEFIDQLVAALPRLIPAAHVTYNEMYPQKSESHNCVNTTELASPTAARLWEQFMNEHPVMVHILRTGDRRAMRISEFWSQRQLHDRGLYSDFYRHYGIEDALCITVPCRSPRVIGVGWHDGRFFTERERVMADLVRPHISQAWRNARLVCRIRRQLQMLKQGMESMGAGVVVCGAGGRVQLINALARRYLAEYFGSWRESDHCLPDELLRWMRHQDAQLCENQAPSIRFPLVHGKGYRRLVIRLLSQPGANLVLMEEERTTPDSSVLDRFGLTPREAEVLAWIAQGKTNQEIAIILAISVGTVKKHVEHIFLKLRVETRTGAAALAVAANPLHVAP